MGDSDFYYPYQCILMTPLPVMLCLRGGGCHASLAPACGLAVHPAWQCEHWSPIPRASRVNRAILDSESVGIGRGLLKVIHLRSIHQTVGDAAAGVVNGDLLAAVDGIVEFQQGLLPICRW